MATWTKLAAAPGSPLIGVTSQQAFAGEAGPPGASDGISLDGAGSLQIEIVAPGAENFTGIINLKAWHRGDLRFDPNSAWIPYEWADISADSNSKPVKRFSVPVIHPAGTIAFLAAATGHSGAGTNFTLNINIAPRTRGA